MWSGMGRGMVSVAMATVIPGPSSSQQESYSATSATVSGTGEAARLDISGLVPTVQELFGAGLATSTQRVYRSGSQRYQKFCQQFDVQAYPATETVLALFVASLFRQGLMAGTIKSYLSAVRYTQISLGFSDPHAIAMPQLEYVTKGRKRKTAGQGARA